eukprot:3913921-Pyramimonas_sp.AAC.1
MDMIWPRHPARNKVALVEGGTFDFLVSNACYPVPILLSSMTFMWVSWRRGFSGRWNGCLVLHRILRMIVHVLSQCIVISH